MTGTEELRRNLAEYLKKNGLEAVAAWGGQARLRAGEPVAAVSLRAYEGGTPGFQDYLGERYDEETGRWVELYGKRVKLTFGLDLYAGTAQEVQMGLDLLVDALGKGGPAGLRPVAFSAGETAYRAEAKRFCCPVHVGFEAWSYARADEDGAFVDFTVRGETKV